MSLAGGARLEDIFAMVQRGEVATLNLVLKADVQGSLEALTDALRKLDQEHEEVRLSFVHRASAGSTSPTSTWRRCRTPRSSASTCVPTARPASSHSREGVEMRLYEVIYQVLEDVQSALVGMLKPEFEEVVTGDAEVREVFSVPAGRQGRRLLRAQRHDHPRLEGAVPARGRRHLERRDRVAQALQGRRARGATGFECGIGLENYQDLKPGDVIETYDQGDRPHAELIALTVGARFSRASSSSRRGRRRTRGRAAGRGRGSRSGRPAARSCPCAR